MKKLILKNSLKALAGLILFSIGASAFALQANTNLILDKESQNGKDIVISINIDNPSNQNISSVQSWLEFDNNQLNCKSINTDESKFDFVVPGESNISGNIIKIGRSSLSGDVSDSKINVAKINCEILDKSGEIKFHDYKTDGGKVSVMVFENGFPVNTLKGEPNSLKVEIPKVEKEEEVKLEIVSENVSYIERPTGLKIDTKIGSATLTWDKVEGAQGYYIYYGKVSGRYLQRRLVPNNEIYNLEGLETGSQYYFSVTAVGTGDIESDYSNEEAVIIGKKMSSTSPLYKVVQSYTNNKNINNSKVGNIKDVKNNKNIIYKNNTVIKNNYLNNKIQNKHIAKNVQTGPAETSILSLFIALAMGVFIYRKKYV